MNRIKKFISMLLATTILLTNFSSVFARSQITDGKELIKIDNNTIINTNFYGEEQLSDLAFAFKDELEYESDKSNQIQTRSIWDFVDVVMAGFSWKDFLKDPSLGNFGWAILDTSSILPFLPSSSYFRKGGKTLLKMDEVAKFASKSSKNKKIIKNGIKKISPSKAKSLIRKIAKGYYLSNDVYRNHILVRHSFNSKVKGTSKFIKGFDIKNAIKKL